MKNFTFRLERVLGWRRAAFTVEEARLGPLLAEEARLQTAREARLAAHERAGRDILVGGAVDGSELAALGGYRARLERELASLGRESAAARERVSTQRVRMVEAHQRVRLLEKLRSRRLEEWHVAAGREIESFASEAFLARWGRSLEGDVKKQA
jgi:flagellar export protein FliJ